MIMSEQEYSTYLLGMLEGYFRCVDIGAVSLCEVCEMAHLPLDITMQMYQCWTEAEFQETSDYE